MEGGLFLLLCLLALFIGTRARRSKVGISPKAIRQKALIKRFMLYTVIVLVSALELFYIPYLYQEIDIAIHTRFSTEIYLSMGIVVVGIIVIVTSIQKVRKPITY